MQIQIGVIILPCFHFLVFPWFWRHLMKTKKTNSNHAGKQFVFLLRLGNKKKMFSRKFVKFHMQRFIKRNCVNGTEYDYVILNSDSLFEWALIKAGVYCAILWNYDIACARSTLSALRVAIERKMNLFCQIWRSVDNKWCELSPFWAADNKFSRDWYVMNFILLFLPVVR